MQKILGDGYLSRTTGTHRYVRTRRGPLGALAQWQGSRRNQRAPVPRARFRYKSEFLGFERNRFSKCNFTTVKFIGTKLNDAFIVEPEPLEDSRGFFARTFC